MRCLHHMMHLSPSQYTCAACAHRLYAVIRYANLDASTLYPQHRLRGDDMNSHHYRLPDRL
jgi:hypothetical protein